MRVGFLHFGQSVDFVVSISFLRSPVLAILAIGCVFLLLGLSLHTSATADGFNGTVLACSRSNTQSLVGGQRDSLPPVYMKQARSALVRLACRWLLRLGICRCRLLIS